ncbi:MAG TPA: SpoIIE family protein phosphatase [Terracidiphilus sp.]|nr:SpoIIE family protein phosphatase [Terracidiphilus sp.]
MPQRTSGLIVLLMALSTSLSGILCLAQQTQPIPPVRYHFGDDAQWANPNFDDSAWPVLSHGGWPLPPFDSDGFIWVRQRVPVGNNGSDALALRIRNRSSFQIADEIYVNGVLVGRQGSLPPGAAPVPLAKDVVFNLPRGAIPEGATALVAFRAWYAPGIRRPSATDNAIFTIGESRDLHLEQRLAHSNLLIDAGPNLVLNGIVFVLGAGLLVFWRRFGSRYLLVSSWMLMGASLMTLWDESVHLGLVPVSMLAYMLVIVGLQSLSMAATAELVWTVYDLRAIGLKRLYQASWVIGNAAYLISSLGTKPSSIVFWFSQAMLPALLCFDCIQLAVSLWALVARRANRLIVTALIAIPVTDLLQDYGHLRSVHIGPFQETYFQLSLFLSEIALFVMLAQKAWKAWRVSDELRVEFDAAREVQQNLVANPVAVPGFTIESIYAPAKQVGGDFFRVLPQSNGGALVVMGDVSGKGLKAAMSVSVIMGALRGCPSQRPAEILAYLNRVLFGQVSGFVTCGVTLIETDGTITLANAGNPAPYRNGREIYVEPGLPLGILSDNCYPETKDRISAGDRLTFVSDGILEATNARGELYGFMRTQAISTQSASSIAEAATLFGQQDDITVLSITLDTALKPLPA